MGRKKRKIVQDADDEGPPLEDMPIDIGAVVPVVVPTEPVLVENTEVVDVKKEEEKPLKSGYAMTSHSAEIIDEDTYVSDGSDEEDEEDIALRNVEMVLAGSRMGVMRRGMHQHMLVQPNRQWHKEENQEHTQEDTEKDENDEAAEQQRLREQEEELAKLDPAQRAAKLLAEKQRKLEEAKVNARRLESEENAGRDPCLFSKRTAFDIRFDQIDDKPWTRGDPTDFFNYSLTEEDWLEYAQLQITIRQELTDASRQRRPPDPTVVPVTPRVPTKQTPRVAVATTTDSEQGMNNENSDAKELGPVLVKQEDNNANNNNTAGTSNDAGPGPSQPEKVVDVPVAGGAWGAGANPGSMLAKLIEAQETGGLLEPTLPPPPIDMKQESATGGGGDDYHNDDQASQQEWNRNEYGSNDDHRSTSHGWQQQDRGGPLDYYGGGGAGSGSGGGAGSGSGGGGGRGYMGGGGRGRGGPPPPPGRGGGGGGGRGGWGGRGGGGGFRDDSGSFQGRGGGGGRGGGFMEEQGGGGGGGGDHFRKRPRDDFHGGGRGGWRR